MVKYIVFLYLHRVISKIENKKNEIKNIIKETMVSEL